MPLSATPLPRYAGTPPRGTPPLGDRTCASRLQGVPRGGIQSMEAPGWDVARNRAQSTLYEDGKVSLQWMLAQGWTLCR